MSHFHAAVWLDHRAAQIYGLGHGAADSDFVKSHGPHHIHHKAGSIGSGHQHNSPDYFRAIAAALAGAHEILILGPSDAKTEFKTYLDANEPALAARVLGVEALERETEGEIIAFARDFFTRADRMTPQR